jgi:hypothetical protein
LAVTRIEGTLVYEWAGSMLDICVVARKRLASLHLRFMGVRDLRWSDIGFDARASESKLQLAAGACLWRMSRHCEDKGRSGQLPALSASVGQSCGMPPRP